MNGHKPNLSEIVVALDIGTTKVCAIAGRKNEYGKLEILGVGKEESTGVLRGVVSNIEKTVKAISDAVIEAERRSGSKVTKVHVGIAGQHIKSLQHHGILTRDAIHEEIAQRDIDKLINDMHKLVLPPGDKIIHVIPQEYTVDNEQGITNPIGMMGNRLEANFHIITGQITASKNIYRCVERANLNVASLTLEPIASAVAVLSDEEKEAGVALVDIGGGTTDIAIFYEGIIRHTAVIPFGGNVITKDIKQGCTVMDNQAESLKVKFGCALTDEVVENRIIAIPGLKGREPKEISEINLARIIEARMEEIMDRVFWEIRQSGFDRKLIGGIVLTGGGALLRNIDKLVELNTGMTTRIGIPIDHLAHGYHEDVCSPIYATAIGLLLKGIQESENGRPAISQPDHSDLSIKNIQQKQPVASENTQEEVGENNNKPSFLDKMFNKIQDFFTADPDSDL